MNIGKKIVNLRENKGWSQRELAKRVNINVSVLNRIEAGERPLRDQELAVISSVLDVSADYLLGTSVDSQRTIRGEQVDISQLNEKQRTVLDWIMSRDSFQTVENKDDLTKLLDEVGVIYDLIHKREK